MAENENKGQRMLSMYDRLLGGEVINKKNLAREFGVTEKSIQRDVEDLRNYLSEAQMKGGHAEILYDREKKGYELIRSSYDHLNKKEILALSKILLESRAFEKGELDELLDRLLGACLPEDRGIVEELVRNEAFSYAPLKHGKKLLDPIWALSVFIKNKEIIRFSYTRQDGAENEHLSKPVALLFSEYYFYLIAYEAENDPGYPLVFRVDRMGEAKGTGAHFAVPYKERFQDGEFRKRVQFMYSGALRRVKFTYSGPSVEAVLDRLPTAKILSEKDGVYTLTAEAYGSGIDMWLDSQGEWVKMI